MPEVLAGPKRSLESNGPESLKGRLAVDDLGTSVIRRAPSPQTSQARAEHSPANDAVAMVFGFIRGVLSDVPDEVVQAASETIISTVRDDLLSETQKRSEISEILGPLPDSKYSSLHTIVKRLPEEGASSVQEGVAVTFEAESEESESSSEEEDEVHEDSTESGSAINDRTWLPELIEPTGRTTKEVLTALDAPANQRENELLELFDYYHLDTVKTLVLNRDKIVWLAKLHAAETGVDREQIVAEIESLGLGHILGKTAAENKPKIVDLEALKYETKVPVPKVHLPEGTERSTSRHYEQYTVPFPSKGAPEVDLVPIASLPDWMQPCFGVEKLNKVQSKTASYALNGDNMLVCAPTGAGKTTIALLAMLSCIEKFRSNGSIDLKAFKMVYIAPLKALVQEQVREFSKRLGPLGVQVAELSGDQSLTHDQLASTQLIVTTPEKWDVVTRKTSDVSYTALVRLVVVDEIHLLHDLRGPALESIVARAERFSKATGNPTRLLGLSATLPNYRDVAQFLNVHEEGIFFFDARWRPTPLTQIFVGVTERNSLKALKAMNDACWDKLQTYAGEHQVIVFVHSRKDTVNTARFLIEKAEEEDNLGLFSSNAPKDETFANPVLTDLVANGFGIHHAGLAREDRSKVEQLFASRRLQVLVSTATLAWGVNLPAHAVIIKGTQIYNPAASAWEELQPQDVLQMLGRAGRPGFDKFGEGVVITKHDMLNYYMGISTAKLPIESRMISRLTDALNAEVAGGLVKTLDEAVDWLGHTYYYVRMLKDRRDYRVDPSYDNDSELVRWRRDLAHSALRELSKGGLVQYQDFAVIGTPLGRIAADFYISPSSMATYDSQLKPYLGPIDIFRIFARSAEFRYIPVRRDEKAEMDRLVKMVPVPVRELPTEATAKINVLLQAYICRLGLPGFALAADTVYVAQSASRLFRAMFEIALVRKWAPLANTLLTLYKVVDRRMWLTASPFRQFAGVPAELVQKTESSTLPWARYFDLETAAEVGQAVRSERHGELALELLNQFPRFELAAQAQPLTRSVLRILVDINPVFEWNRDIHGPSLRFWLAVTDGESLLYSDWYVCRENTGPQTVSLSVAIEEPVPPHYFVVLESEHWLHSDAKVAVSLESLVLPAKFPAPTAIQEAEGPAEGPAEWSPQLKMAWPMLNSEQSAFVGLAPRGGQDTLAVAARAARQQGKMVYIVPFPEQVRVVAELIEAAALSGSESDIVVLRESDVVVACARDYELLTRRWQRRRALHAIRYLVCVGCSWMGGYTGHLYEVAISRTKFMAAQLEFPLRVLGLSVPVAPRELPLWLGAPKSAVLNFSTLERDPPLQITCEAVLPRPYASQMMVLARPVFELLKQAFANNQTAIVWVADYRQALKTAGELTQLAALANLSDFPEPTISSPGKLVIATADSDDVWTVESAGLSIIMNTETYSANEDKHIPYTAGQVLEFAGTGRDAVVFTSTLQSTYYRKFLTEPLPVESNLPVAINDALAVEIAEGVVRNAEDALEWLSYTYMFTRLRANPTYYGLADASDDSVNEFLSELVETSFEELAESGIIAVSGDEMDVEPRNGAHIAARHGVSAATVAAITQLGPRARLRSLLETLCTAPELELPSRHDSLHSLEGRVPLQSAGLEAPSRKVFVLLQAYLSRLKLSQTLQNDAKTTAGLMLPLLAAAVDILAGDGYLSALSAIDLHQMMVQGVWDRDSPLKQIPHVDNNTVERCVARGVENVHDFMAIEDDALREQMLGFSEEDPRMLEVAQFVNRYPSIDITASSGPVVAGEPAVMTVTIESEIDDEEDTQVVSPLSGNRRVQWYLVVGSSAARELYGIKKVQVLEPEQAFEVGYVVPMSGHHNLTVWCVCDSYLDADKEAQVSIDAS